jgi:2-oxoisovalerate dehydrogenase E1 component alpha subunit
VPVSEQTRSASIAAKASAYGMAGIRCDGNDVLACYMATRRAVEAARAGGGPTLIEAVTYRIAGHTTSDDPRRYRSDAEVERWRALDPLSRYQAFLRQEALWSEDVEVRCRGRASALAEGLRQGVTGAPEPDPSRIFDAVFRWPTPALREQAAQLAAEMGRETS